MLYEKDQIYDHGSLILAGSFLLVTLLTLLPFWIFHYQSDRHHLIEPVDRSSRAAGFIERIPPPRLQTLPREEAQRYREKQQKILSSYGWEDRQEGLVRIPIEEAIKRYEASLRSEKP